MLDIRNEPVATWRQAMDNIRAGQIRLSDNRPFTATGFYYGIAHSKFDTTPSVILTIDIGGSPNEAYIEFKDGSKFGIEFLSADSSRINYRHFIYFSEYDIIGYTNAGTPFTWSDSSNLPATFPIQFTPDPLVTEPCTVDKLVCSFGMFLNNDGTIDMDSYTLKYIDYAYSGHSEHVTLWQYNYSNFMSDDTTTYGTFGYLESQSHIVDWLCGQFSPPTEYPGENSQTGGGSGNFINQNDVIDIPPLPSIQAIDFGFATIYNPSIANIQAVASWLWSDDFDEAIKLNYISPFDNIVGLAIVPVNVSSVAGILRVGNVDSNIAVPRVTNQYGEIDCGVINVKEYWGSFLDYNASYSIYLPFIGYRALKPDDMVNGELGVVYHYDLLTGIVIAFVWARKEDNIKHVLYTYTGNMFYNVAFSGANFMSLYNQQLSATTSGINNAMSSIGQIASGNIAGGITSLITGTAQAQRQYDTAKPDYGRGGNNGGNAGLFSIRYPYIIQSLPIGQTPGNYKQLQGIPSQIYSKLGDLTGYTEIESVIVNTLTCTEEEQIQIVQQLKEGVIL